MPCASCVSDTYSKFLMVLREIAYVYHWQSLTCQANSHNSRQNTIPVGPSGNVFANSSWSVRFSFKHFWPHFCSCTNICRVLKFYFFFPCWKKGAPSVPAWGTPCRRGSYEAKPDSRQSGSTHCLLSLLCNQPFAWGKEKRHSRENGALIQKSLPYDTK